MHNVVLTNTYHVPGSADPVATYENHCIKDARCLTSTYERLGNDVRVLKDEIHDDVLEREILLHPHDHTIPAIISTFVGNDALDLVQRTVYNFKTHEGEMKSWMVSSAMRGKFEATAGISLRAAGSFAPRRITYEMDTDVVSNVTFIGSLLEKSITNELKERGPRLEAMNQEWLDEAVASEEAAEDADVFVDALS